MTRRAFDSPFSNLQSSLLHPPPLSLKTSAGDIPVESSAPPSDRQDMARGAIKVAASSLPVCPPVGLSNTSQRNHRAETLTMLVPAELVVVGMLGRLGRLGVEGWLGGGGGLLSGRGPWRPSPSGLKAGGAGRLMMAVVIRPLLQLILLRLSVFRLRLERLEKHNKTGKSIMSPKEI